MRSRGALFLAALWCLAAFAVGLPSPLRAEADGKELLLRIGMTAVEKNYTGRKMLINFSRLTPQVTKLTVVHHLGGKERREYPASRAVVIIDGNTLWQYYPRKRLVVKKKLPGEGGWRELQQENLQQTLVSYELKHSPSERIAGRESHLYEFRPRQAGSRPLRRVWVDTETGLILRTEIYSPDNKLFWLSVFEDLDYRPTVSPASFAFKVPTGVRVVESEKERCLDPEEAEQIAGLPLTLPRYLPSGFVRKCVRARRSKDYGEIQVVFSDGLSLLSFFESSRFRPSLTQRGGGQAQVSGYAGSWHNLGLVTALGWHPPWAHLTILGEISRKELLKVATSVPATRELSPP